MIPNNQTFSFAIWSSSARDDERQCVLVLMACAVDALTDKQITERIGKDAHRGLPVHHRIGWLVEEKMLRVIQAEGGVYYAPTAKGFSKLRHILPPSVAA